MKVTLISIYINHGDKLQCFTTMNMNDACCDDEKPQTPSCKTLVQEAKKFMEEMQQKAALLPDELKTEFQSIMGGNKN